MVVAILFLLLMGALMTLPRQRENARLANCRLNLMQIGVGLGMYDRFEGYLPTVPRLGLNASASDQSTLRALLETLSLPDLTSLSDPATPPKPIPNSAPGEIFLKGFVCPTDPYGTRDSKRAAVSYRATAGDDPSGTNGAFAPGRRLKISEVEDADGKSVTAAFSERLIGNSKPDASKVNYAVSPGPITPQGCPEAETAQWRGDAGDSWREASWRSTLYNHSLTPNAALSCIAEDQLSAMIGASSAHSVGVNVLMLDGSVRTVTLTIDPKIWQAMATTSGAAEGR